MSIYNNIIKAKKEGRKLLSVLIDPDHTSDDILIGIKNAIEAHVDYFFIGGSLLHGNAAGELIDFIKSNSNIPVILFPGSTMQINIEADALLYSSVISGRNPELLIGRHVESAFLLKKSPLEIISLGYMLIDSGQVTSVNYMSNTQPIPHDKRSIAVSTAIAGELLGLKMIYLEAGSGARRAVSSKMIQDVSHNISIPLIVGGGIREPEMATAALLSGADMVVIGNAAEKDPSLIFDMSAAVHSLKSKIT